MDTLGLLTGVIKFIIITVVVATTPSTSGSHYTRGTKIIGVRIIIFRPVSFTYLSNKITHKSYCQCWRQFCYRHLSLVSKCDVLFFLIYSIYNVVLFNTGRIWLFHLTVATCSCYTHIPDFPYILSLSSTWLMYDPLEWNKFPVKNIDCCV